MSDDSNNSASNDPAGIEVGQAGDDLRYWLAKEAMRQGEARLTAQSATRVALEARATALTGWSAIGFLAVAGVGLNATIYGPAFWGAAVAATLLFIAGALGIIAARPRGWSITGFKPDYVVEVGNRYDTELETVESLNGGLLEGININDGRLDRMGQLLRWAGWVVLLAPVAGGATFYARNTGLL